MKKEILCIPSKDGSIEQLQKLIDEWVASKEAFGVSIKGLSERSLSQNALLHVWLRQYAGHLLKKDSKKVSEKEIEHMKLTAKRRCYAQNRYEWLIKHNLDLITGESSKGLTSSKKWARGEMFQFMEWLQMFGADDGLILESKGEFEKLQQEAQT